MKRAAEFLLGLALVLMLLCIGWTLGWRQATIGLVFSLIWFIIALVLLTRPPGIPEIAQPDSSIDLPTVTRKDVLPVLPRPVRWRISLIVACGVCLIVWISLGW